jgi:hypothetical protein
MLVDYVRVYQDASLGVEEHISKDNPIIPTFISDKLDITFPDSYQSRKVIAVYDINGRSILNKQTDENIINIDSSTLSKGIYFVKIVAGDRLYTQKVIKK